MKEKAYAVEHGRTRTLDAQSFEAPLLVLGLREEPLNHSEQITPWRSAIGALNGEPAPLRGRAHGETSRSLPCLRMRARTNSLSAGERSAVTPLWRHPRSYRRSISSVPSSRQRTSNQDKLAKKGSSAGSGMSDDQSRLRLDPCRETSSSASAGRDFIAASLRAFAVYGPSVFDPIPAPAWLGSSLRYTTRARPKRRYEAEAPHRLVRFEGPYGPPGAPEIVLELA